jgi:uncharacterized protein (DUF1330 family)
MLQRGCDPLWSRRDGVSAFVIAEVLEVHDPDGMKRYAERAHATVEQYGGAYRALRGKFHLRGRSGMTSSAWIVALTKTGDRRCE